MLARPSRHGRCIFCIHRTAAAGPIRQSSTSTNERSFRSSPPFRRPFPSNRSHVQRPSDKAADRKVVPLHVVQTRILKVALPALKTQLKSTKATEDTEESQLTALDPTGQKWQAFQQYVTELVENSEAILPRSGNTLLSAVGNAASANSWQKELSRALHFGFIDYVLDSQPGKAGGTVADLRYPTEWYAGARATQRNVHLHVGPTNSGKTYNALKRLEEKGSGFYGGPLRLLAHEVYSRFKAKGIPCDLITGDDIRLDDNLDVALAASTVEMVDTAKPVEVAVIDEIQMMEADERGWAWTRAFLGANAREVHLCGEPRVIPLIKELTASMGDALHIHRYDRLNPLKVMNQSLKGDLKNLKKGDCVVSFSIINIHALKKQIELDTGKRCAIVYGSLPPETRAQQAALFNDPDNDYDYLVASDAIGMGLNLSVKRIIFHSIVKFNGFQMERLSIPQLKQIAGRAGRYRSAHQAMNKTSGKSNSNAETNVGLVTTLNESDLPFVREALNENASPIRKAGILPPGEYLVEVASRLPRGVPFEYILRRVCIAAEMHPRFKVCDIREQSELGRVIEEVRGLSIPQRLIFTAAPASSATGHLHRVLKALAQIVSDRREVTVVDVPEIRLEVLETPLSGDRKYLEQLEDLHKSLILYLWLSYRFINNFKDRDMATHAKELAEEKINTCLLEFSANPALRKKVLSHKTHIIHGTSTLIQVPEGTSQLSLAENSESALPVDWAQSPMDGGISAGGIGGNAATTSA